MPRFTSMLVTGGIAAVATVSLLAGTPAFADPNHTPAKGDIVGTGSDTTQGVNDALAAHHNAQFSTGPRLFSWDAVGSPTITEKLGCATRTRPNGSSAGIAELEANLRPSSDTSHYCVDFARSSRARDTTADPASIVFVQYAIDAVTWAAENTTNAPGTLNTTQLKAIYSCDASILGTGHTGNVTWDEVGGKGSAQVVPVIPQSSSGTRKFFLSSIGVTTLGSCVQGQDNSVEENEGTNSIFKSTSAPNIVFPYSVAVYLAQTQGNHGAGDQGPMALKKVNGVVPIVGTAPNKTINKNFPYQRHVYSVVRNASTSGSRVVPMYLQSIFGHGAGTGWICTNATAKADIRSWGFLPDPYCGTLS